MTNTREGTLTSKLLLQQVSRYGVGIGGPAIISAVSTAVFTRLFDAHTYGIFTVAIATVTLAVSFFGQWLQQPLGRYMAGAHERDAIELIRAGILGLMFLSVVAAIAAALVPALFSSELGSYLRVWIPGVLCFWLQLLLSSATVVVQAQMDARFYSQQQVIAAVCRFGMSLLLIWLVGRDSVMLLWGTAVGTLVVLPRALQRSGFLRQLGGAWSARRSGWERLKAMSSYGLPMMVWFVAANLLSNSDRLIIASFRGSAEAGIYGANYNLMNGTVGLVTAPVLAATWPFLMKAWGAGNVKEAGLWLGRIASGVLAGGLLLSGVVALLANDMASLLLGPSFREGAMVMPTVVAGMVALAVATYANKPFEFYARMRVMVLLAVATALVNLAMNLALVPHYGYHASAWATLCCYLLYASTSVVVGRKLLRWQWERRVIAAGGIGAVAGYAAGFSILHLMGLFPAVLRAIAGGTAYTVFVAAIFCVMYWKNLAAALAVRRVRANG